MNVLVLCTGNSARSIIGEVLINELGGGELRGYSAGSHPVGKVNPGAIDKLLRAGHSIEGLESKSWDQFSAAHAPAIDIVLTVCDNAAGESCPVWRGAPVTAHWGIPDPAVGSDDSVEIQKAFDRAYERLRWRIEALLALPLSEMSAPEISAALKRIHRSGRRPT